MRVCDLIEELKAMDQEADVHFTYNYGDYWKTVVAPEVTSVDVGHIVHSTYHSMPKVVDVEDDRRAQDKATKVVFIS